LGLVVVGKKEADILIPEATGTRTRNQNETATAGGGDIARE